MADNSASVRAPRTARRAIESDFSRQFSRYFSGKPPTAHPRAVDLLWSMSGHSVGAVNRTARSVLKDSAARGFSIDLGVVAARWES